MCYTSLVHNQISTVDMAAVNFVEGFDLQYNQWKDPFIQIEGRTPDLRGELENHILTNHGSQNVRFIERGQQWLTWDRNGNILLGWVWGYKMEKEWGLKRTYEGEVAADGN